MQIKNAIVFALLFISASASLVFTQHAPTLGIGNSLSDPSQGSVQQTVDDMFVLPDGRIVTNSFWSENGREAQVYQKGGVSATLPNMHQCGGSAVTANQKYIFASALPGCAQGGLNVIRRFSLSSYAQIGDDLPVSSSNSGLTFGPFGLGTPSITGLAASNTRLFVSDAASQCIRIYDAETLIQGLTFPFLDPGKMVLDKAGNLWIIQTSTGWVLNLSPEGEFLNRGIILPEGTIPTAIGLDAQGYLLIGDSGPSQQILTYNITTTDTFPYLARRFGQLHGTNSGSTPGLMQPLSLQNPVGVGTDSDGNLYIANSLPGADIRAFSTDSQLLWNLFDLVGNDVAVPDANGDLYTKFHRWVKSGNKWIPAAFTVDLLRYPSDPRLNPYIGLQGQSILAIRLIGGKKFMYLTDMYSFSLQVYRFDGEIAVPVAIFANGYQPGWLPGIQPVNQAWLWRDSNNDGTVQAGEIVSLGPHLHGQAWGWEVDAAGNIWQAQEYIGIKKYPLGGLDTNNIPRYDPETVVITPLSALAPLTQVERLMYDAGADTMYLTGYTASNPQDPDSESRFGLFGLVGTELIRIDNWSTTRQVALRFTIEYDVLNGRFGKAVAMAGNRLFVGMTNVTPLDYICVYDAGTGVELQPLLPDPEVGGPIVSWFCGTHQLRAFYSSAEVSPYTVYAANNFDGKVLRLTYNH